MRVILAEDNELLGDALVTALKQEGYAVDWIRNGKDAVNAPLAENFDIAILDLGLPGLDGLSVLRTWRANKLDFPVLILTARDTTASRVEGLDSGADDYLVKPFERDELMARLRSLLRRAEKGGQKDGVITFGDICMNIAEHSITYCNVPVNLSRREFTLLHVLLAKPGKVFSREKLQQAIYSWDDDIASNTVDVHIHNIRKKFYPEIIKTLRGIGYVAAEKNSTFEDDI